MCFYLARKQTGERVQEKECLVNILSVVVVPVVWCMYVSRCRNGVFCIVIIIVLPSRPWPKKVQGLMERLLVITLSSLVLLYLRISVLAGGVPTSFGESDNPTSFHGDILTRCRTYSYLCAFNVWLLLCPSALCYDWSMDSITRIESSIDLRNLATAGLVCVATCLSVYGE